MSGAVPLVCICGPSAAGKTTFAAHLAEQLRARGHQPLLISCDDYYRSGWSPNSRYGFDTVDAIDADQLRLCLLYTSPSPRDDELSRMPSSA